MMFKQSVAGICNEFTAKLEDIQTAKLKEVTTINKKTEVLTKKLKISEDKADEALAEVGRAGTAIRNIQKLFGVNV